MVRPAFHLAQISESWSDVDLSSGPMWIGVASGKAPVETVSKTAGISVTAINILVIIA